MDLNIISSEFKYPDALNKNSFRFLSNSFRSEKYRSPKTQGSSDEMYRSNAEVNINFNRKIKTMDEGKQKKSIKTEENQPYCLNKIEQHVNKNYSNDQQKEKNNVFHKTLNQNLNHRNVFEDGAKFGEWIGLKPLTLKKKLNLIKKHKQLMNQQFFKRKASLEFKERSLMKQENETKTFEAKWKKIRKQRLERQQEKSELRKQKQLFEQQHMRQNYLLKNSVVKSQQNLMSSRVSLCFEKIRKANQVRCQKRQSLQEKQIFESQDISLKRKQYRQIKSLQKKTHEAVESCSRDRKVSVNERKLHQISKQLVSLNHEKKKILTFYRIKNDCEDYRNHIKNRKNELQNKARQYKLNLMLELDQRFKKNIRYDDEFGVQQMNSSKYSQSPTKKRRTVSTASDLNFHCTKSNAIYKRWESVIIPKIICQKSNLQ